MRVLDPARLSIHLDPLRGLMTRSAFDRLSLAVIYILCEAQVVVSDERQRNSTVELLGLYRDTIAAVESRTNKLELCLPLD